MRLISLLQNFILHLLLTVGDSLFPGSSFRAQLVEFEQDYGQMKLRLQDLEEKSSQRERAAAKLESKNKSLERKLDELMKQMKDLEKENQLLGLQVCYTPYIKIVCF